MLSQMFLILAVVGVGVLHTMVPDHWLPIALIARQKKWSREKIASVAFKAGVGHSLSTLLLGVVVWLAGVAFATRFGTIVDDISSIALVLFGLWFAYSSWSEMHHEHAHHEAHTHDHGHDHAHHEGVDSHRTALLLILGSSPMVEGIPAFFAASKYGLGFLVVMGMVFALSTIATYVLLCTFSHARLQNTGLGAFERYGEVLSGALIALVGTVFFVWPMV